VSGIPGDAAAWRVLARAGQPPTWKLLAEGSGGHVVEEDGLLAAIVPAAPERSVFNSVFYEDPGVLLDSLDRLDAHYLEAGVQAWTVWVPEDETETAAALEAAGHTLDATPRDMAMAISDLREPEPGEGLEFSEREDYEAMAALNEIAYGYPPGDFAAVAEAKMPGLRIYFASVDGEEAATLAIWPHGSDAVVIWVATAPEARGRGVATRLLAHSLADAREAGLVTTTLQATKLGYPVYERLGYRDFGTTQMWERRRS
jgi:GNAT superfamily N-acetyltransferase